MNVSDRRIDANRRNALLSTGPRTVEGKTHSRANALTHGLCASVVVAEDAAAVLGRANEFYNTLRPQNDWHCWVVGEISLLTTKIDRLERMDRRTRDKIAIRAENCWDDDKRMQAEMLGEQLGNRPAVIVEKLRSTPQGCEWLMERWAMLAYLAKQDITWTPEQNQIAFDLLGTPHDFRVGIAPGVSIDFRGDVVDEGKTPAAVANREIDFLMRRIEDINGLDQANRALAMADLYDDHDAELKRLHKYEGSLHSKLRWFVRQLQEQAPPREVPHWLKRKWLGDPELPQTPPIPVATVPEPTAVADEPEWVAKKKLADALQPIDLEPDEIPPPGERPDYPKILTDRRIKQIKQADNRREAQRRKAEKLRA